MREIDIKFKQYKTHVYIEGSLKNKNIILMLHGGPGHDCVYLKPLFDLSKYGYTVISYDQFGGGKSSNCLDKTKYKCETFVDELDNLIHKLKLINFNLLGHSWGGMLALMYLINKKNTVKDLILFSTLSSSKIWSESNYKICLKNLEDKQEIELLKKAHEKCDYSEKNVKSLLDKKLWNKIYRVKTNTSPYPKNKHKKLRSEAAIYKKMWGSNELISDGDLKSWDVTNKLKFIKNRTLIINGKYDQSTKEVNDALIKNIPNNQHLFLLNSGHGGYYSEYHKTIDNIVDFLKK